MKYFLLMLFFVSCIVNAQEIKVKRTRQLTPGEPGEYAVEAGFGISNLNLGIAYKF